MIALTKAYDCHAMSHKEMADMFWSELGKYVKNPEFQTLQNMYFLYLWAVHDDHELAKCFADAMKWSGITNIFNEYEKHGWE